jgi:hypothetical protein
MDATFAATLPRTLPSASITNHFRSIDAGFTNIVFMLALCPKLGERVKSLGVNFKGTEIWGEKAASEFACFCYVEFYVK